MSHKGKLTSLLMSSTCLAMLTAATATAALADTGGIETVTVTAQKFSQNILDVPMSVTALTSIQLSQANIVSATDLQFNTPGLVMGHYGSDIFPIMRGAGAAGTNDIAVPIYSDGMYQAHSGQALQDYLDVERVEVLYGPQGTLYGHDSLGGAINIIPNKPSFEKFDYGIALKGGNYNSHHEAGFVNIPLTDGLAVRATVTSDYHDPYVENIYNKHAGMKDENSFDARMQVRWSPIEQLDIVGGFEYWKAIGRGNGDYGYKNLGIAVDPFTKYLCGDTTCHGYMDPRNGQRAGWQGGRSQAGQWPNPTSLVLPDPYQVQQDYIPHRNIQQQSYWIKVDWQAPYNDVTLSAKKENYYELRTTDSDYSPSATGLVAGQMIWASAIQGDLTVHSTFEGPFDYTFGASYYDNADPKKNGSAFLWGYAYMYGGSAQRPHWASWLYNSTGGTKDEAIYGQAEYTLWDKLTLQAGGRWSHSSRTYYGHNILSSTENDFVPSFKAAVTTIKTGKDTYYSWRLGAQYHVDDHNMVYVSASTGFIPGGLQSGYNGALLPGNSVLAYEIGAKGTLLDGELAYTAAAWWNKYSNLLTTVYINQGGTIISQSIPGGGSIAKGMSFNLAYTPTDNWKLNLGMAFDDSRFAKYSGADQYNAPSACGPAPHGSNPCGEGGDIIASNNQAFYIMNGQKQAFSPDVTVALDGAYTFHLDGYGTLTPWARVYFSSPYKVMNAPYFWDRQNTYALMDMALTWAPADKYDIKAFVQNLANTPVMTMGQVFSKGRAVVDYNDPRTYGVRLSYNF